MESETTILFDLTTQVRAALLRSDDLRRAPWRGSLDPYAGHCYVACEALRALAAERGIALAPQFLRWEDAPHWFLRVAGGVLDGMVVDPTADQFNERPLYQFGAGKGFLTKEPSKRARTLLSRVEVAHG